MEPLGDVQTFGVRMPAHVEPGRVLEPDAVDHQRVAVPAAHRVAHERRIRIFRQRAPVHVNLPVRQILIQDRDQRPEFE